jgi:hypothetical protein
MIEKPAPSAGRSRFRARPRACDDQAREGFIAGLPRVQPKAASRP